MSITVVVTRDYDNVPTCFEKYEGGTRWRVNSGNLEIFVGTTLAALYPSGNWISVYLDDAMQLHKGATMPDYSGMPRVEVGGRGSAVPAGSPTRGPADGVSGGMAPVERPAAEVFRADGTPWSADDDEDGDRSGDEVPLSATTASFFPDDVVDNRAAMMPVAFRPRRYRTTPPPAKKAPTGPRLLPVRFRRRFAQNQAPAEPVSDAPRMMQVTMRTTIYRAARPAPDDTPSVEDDTTDESGED